jgi:cytochrome c oxidase assembly protein subunit 15
MKGLRRVAWAALALAYIHTVFGAIVRISGSGMGCGEHWPDCNGSVVPTVTSYTVAVEVTHRYLAAMLLLATIALTSMALARRRSPDVGGRGGVLRPAILALCLVLTAALVGMVVVKLSLSNPYVIAIHYSIAMVTLATLVVAVQRAGGLGAVGVREGRGTERSYRSARATAALAFVTVVFGALTANVPGAAGSCRGFPWCRGGTLLQGAPLDIQLTHRALAIVLFLHLCATVTVVSRRGESQPVVRAAQSALGVMVLQILIAAALVELRLPPVLQSLHQAVGTLLWVTVFTYAALARRAGTEHLEVIPRAVVPSGMVA